MFLSSSLSPVRSREKQVVLRSFEYFYVSVEGARKQKKKMNQKNASTSHLVDSCTDSSLFVSTAKYIQRDAGKVREEEKVHSTVLSSSTNTLPMNAPVVTTALVNVVNVIDKSKSNLNSRVNKSPSCGHEQATLGASPCALSLTVKQSHRVQESSSSVDKCHECLRQTKQSEPLKSYSFYTSNFKSLSSSSTPPSSSSSSSTASSRLSGALFSGEVELASDNVSSSSTSWRRWSNGPASMINLVRSFSTNDTPYQQQVFTAGASKCSHTKKRQSKSLPMSPESESNDHRVISEESSRDTASGCTETKSVGVDLKRSMVIAGSALRTIVQGLVNRGESITSTGNSSSIKNNTSSSSEVNVSTSSSTCSQVEDDSLPLTCSTRQASRLHCQVTRNRIDREYKFDERTETWYREREETSCTRKRQNVQQIKSTSKQVDVCSGNKNVTLHHILPKCSSTNNSNLCDNKVSSSSGTILPVTLHQVTQSYSVDDIDRLIQRSPVRDTKITRNETSEQMSTVKRSCETINCRQICSQGKLKKLINNKDKVHWSVIDAVTASCEQVMCDEETSTHDKQRIQLLNSNNQRDAQREESGRLNDHEWHSKQQQQQQLMYSSDCGDSTSQGYRHRHRRDHCDRHRRVNQLHLKKCNSNYEIASVLSAMQRDHAREDDDHADHHDECAWRMKKLPREETHQQRRRGARRSIDFGVSVSQYSFAIKEEEEEADEEKKKKKARDNLFDQGKLVNEQQRRHQIVDSCCSEGSTAAVVMSAGSKAPHGDSTQSGQIASVTSELTRGHEKVSEKSIPTKSTCIDRVTIHETETEGCDEEPHHQMLTSRISYPDDTFTFKCTANLSNICTNDSFIRTSCHSTCTGGTNDSSSDNSYQEATIDSSKSHSQYSESKKNKKLTKYISTETKRTNNTTRSATVHSFASFFSTLSSSAVALATSAAPSLLSSSSTRGESSSRFSSSSSSSSSFTSSVSSSSFSASLKSFTSRSLVNSVIAKCTGRFSSRKGRQEKAEEEEEEEEENLYEKSTVDTLNRRLLLGRSISESSMQSSTSHSRESDSIKFCSLCLESLPIQHFFTISSCKCSFCRECLSFYLKNLIRENSVHVPYITCPDADCPAGSKASKRKSESKLPSLISSISLETIKSTSGLKASLSFLQGKESKKSNEKHQASSSSNYLSFLETNASNLISSQEIVSLVDENTYKLYVKLKIEFEVRCDPSKTFCPMPNCDNICTVIRPAMTTAHSSEKYSSKNKSFNSIVSIASQDAPVITSIITAPETSDNCCNSNYSDVEMFPVYCEKCRVSFCFKCRSTYHPGTSCTSQSQDDLNKYLLAAANEQEGAEIKRCPRCSIWIERDDGCAQMMCRKCRFVFCWFCLTSLEDDFLLRHYDSGPCKNKLGHSRASVMWHRTQVLGIFAGFGVLLLLVAPLFLIAFPCIVCCSCCSKTRNCCKWIQEDDEFDEDDSHDDGPSFATFLPHE